MADTIKFLHCADLHLDARLTGSGMCADLASLRREELRETFVKIIELARHEKVKLLFISGDLWEHGCVRRETALTISELLGSLTQTKVFISPGNHDPLARNSYYQILRWPENVHIFAGGPTCIQLPDWETEVWGYGFLGHEEREPVLSRVGPVNGNRLNFLVSHAEVLSGLGNAGSVYLPLPEQSIDSLGMDYLALGHIHKASGLRKTGNTIWAYPGSPEPLGFDESGPNHGVVLGEASLQNGPQRISAHWRPTAQREFTELSIDISSAETREAVKNRVRALLSEQGDSGDGVFKITLTGRRDPGLLPDCRLLETALSCETYHLKVIDATVPAYDLAALSAGSDLVRGFIRRMGELEAAAQTEEERAQIRRALYYGLDALVLGEVSER